MVQLVFLHESKENFFFHMNKRIEREINQLFTRTRISFVETCSLSPTQTSENVRSKYLIGDFDI
jgi:hypothetical protein